MDIEHAHVSRLHGVRAKEGLQRKGNARSDGRKEIKNNNFPRRARTRVFPLIFLPPFTSFYRDLHLDRAIFPFLFGFRHVRNDRNTSSHSACRISQAGNKFCIESFSVSLGHDFAY